MIKLQGGSSCYSWRLPRPRWLYGSVVACSEIEGCSRSVRSVMLSSIDVHVQFLNKSEKIRALSSVQDLFSCDLEYDEDFILTHISKATNVCVRYTVPTTYPFKNLCLISRYTY